MNKLSIALLSVLIIACHSEKDKNTTGNMNQRFDAYKENFVLELWKVYPGWASSQGFHKYDSVLTVPNDEARQQQLAFAMANLDSLKAFEINTLSDNNKTDFYMIQDQLNATVWSINEEKSYEWDPAGYNVAGAFAEMLTNNYDTLETRLHNFYLRMQNIPAFYSAAKANIKNPTLVHTQLAIDQNLGGISIFEKDLPDALTKSKLTDEEKKQILDRAKAATDAIKDFATWLKEFKNETPRDFRLGENLYRKKFEYQILSGYTSDEVFAKAIAHKKELHQQMAQLTTQLWPKYFPNENKPSDSLIMIRQMIDKLSLNHVAPDSFQVAIEKQMPELVNFIKEKNLIYLDPSKPLVVRKEPDYMAGVAGASISSPGPYDKNGNTYYNVGSLAG